MRTWQTNWLISVSGRTDLCINISPEFQKALHHLLQAPAAREVERWLPISSLFVSFPVRSWSPGAVDVTTAAYTNTRCVVVSWDQTPHSSKTLTDRIHFRHPYIINCKTSTMSSIAQVQVPCQSLQWTVHTTITLIMRQPTDLRMRKQAETSLFSSIALCRRVCWQSEGPVFQHVASQPWRT